MKETRSLEVPHEAWHAHPVQDVLLAFDTDECGLSEEEAKVRTLQFGANKFSELRPPGIISRTFTQLRSPLALVLVVACFLTVALGEYLDAGVIFFALAVAVTVGVLQEGRASRAFRALAEQQVQFATVLRDGEKHEVRAEELVPGDVVEIQGGMQVPADIRLFEAKKLSVNESSLTGEWLPTKKHAETVDVGVPFAEQENMLWMGTYAIEGHGKGVVVATGDATAIGALAKGLHEIEPEETPLQAEMRRVSNVMLSIIMALVIFLFAVGTMSGQPLGDMILMAIAIAVASVPEGLPAAVTIILAVGMETLLRRGGLVRNLLAAETLGSTTYVLTDKTGTLTLAEMAMTGVIHNDTTNLAPATWKTNAAISNILEVALAASDAYADHVHGRTIMRGDPIERAILDAAEEAGIHAESASLRAARLDHLAFTSENRFAAGLAPYGKAHERRLCVNGSPEYLIALASRVYEDGNERKMTEADRAAYLSAIASHTKEGKRLIGVAYKQVAYDAIPEDDAPAESLIKRELVFMGVLIFNDPVRKRIATAIEGVKNAGATVLLVTGDNPETALSVARTAGIADRHGIALVGDELADLSDEELLDVLDSVHVFARVLPNQKMRIAEVLQRRGEVVAMTGDGTNDAPALRRADIGIAVGSGTDVAKEASDLVLLNDSFEIMFAAIEEGRRIVANLRKVVGYLLSTSLAEVVLIAAALLSAAPLPLVPAQILWANLIEEGLMSFAFAFEKGEKDAMKRRPQDIYEEGILSTAMIWFVLFVVSVTSMLLLGLYFYLRSVGTPIEEVRSTMFLAVAVDSMFMAFAFRSLSTPLWRIPFAQNAFFFVSFAVSGALLALVLTVPFFRDLLSYQPLPTLDIVLVVGFCAGALLAVELGKWLFLEDRGEKSAVVK